MISKHKWNNGHMFLILCISLFLILCIRLLTCPLMFPFSLLFVKLYLDAFVCSCQKLVSKILSLLFCLLISYCMYACLFDHYGQSTLRELLKAQFHRLNMTNCCCFCSSLFYAFNCYAASDQSALYSINTHYMSSIVCCSLLVFL